MPEESDSPEETPPKGSKKPLLIGIVLALLGGGGGFFAVQSGVFGSSAHEVDAQGHRAESHAATATTATFVALDPLVISLPGTGGRDHLRFSAQLEVAPEYAGEVEAIKPRIVDVLNGYLRAVELTELEDPTALTRLRAQMLRRVQIVAGEGRIHDLLIMEFVLS